MPLAMRPAGRFFSAFYRWSCSTQQATCRHVPRPNAPRNCRSYSGTRWLQRDNGYREGALPQSNAFQDMKSKSGDYQEHLEPPAMKIAIRNLMRHVPSSVSVITVHASQPGHDEVLPIGSAISSLTTVTLDPPHISFNIKTPSRTFSAVQEAGGWFRVHFLDDSVAAAELAHNFTQGNSEHALAERAQMLDFQSDSASNPMSAPRIVSDAVVASMDCQLLQEVPVADHIVAIAKVEGFRSREDLRPTLLYNEGKYKRNNGTALLDPQRFVKSAGKSSEFSARRAPPNDDVEGSHPIRRVPQTSSPDTAA